MMGDLNGSEVGRRLKALPQTRDVPVIMVTALSDEKYIKKGREVGAEDHLIRPLRRTELLERVAVVLAARSSVDETALATAGSDVGSHILNAISALQGLEVFETDSVDGELLGTAIDELERLLEELR